GFVVDDVVDARLATLDCDRGRSGRVVNVEKRPHPGALPDEREPPGADQRRVLPLHRGAGTVEGSIAEDDALDRTRGGNRLLQIANRVQRDLLLRRRTRIERIQLRLDTRAGPFVGPA